ncbi:MAG: cell surface protein SprA, partial [Paludibacter sp.]
MRRYKRFQMFVHAEEMLSAVAQKLKNGELSCFIRLGSDMSNNYYEYEIPLTLTPSGLYTSDKLSDREKVWPKENMFDFAFSVLTNAKLKRNKERESGQNGVNNVTPFIVYDKNKPKNKITILGNPSLSDVENIMIGVRNNTNELKSGEVWINEMRMSEFDESGGWAGLANVAVNLSDIGSLNIAGKMETAGFGGIESNITNRTLEDSYQINFSAGLDLGRFLPRQAKLQIPAYYTYSTQNQSPKYNPLDEDIELKDAIKSLDGNKSKIDSLKQRTQRNVVTESFNITNAKVNIRSKIPMPYDPANFSVTFSTSKTDEHTPEIQQNLNKQQRLALNYNYN